NQEIKKNHSIEKLLPVDNILFPYDIDFKKPHFSRYSVFEDDIAAFKDESSPNLLSTAASSLSSLTIDDDDYNYNIKPIKAGLVKSKPNIINLTQMEKVTVQKQWRKDPIGSVIVDSNQTNQKGINNFSTHSFNKYENTNEKLHTCSFENSCECQMVHKKKIITSECNMKRSNFNIITNRYPKNVQIIHNEEDDSTEGTDFKTELHIEHTRTNVKNICQDNEIFVNYGEAELDVCNKYFNSNGSKGYDVRECSHENRLLYEPYRYNSKLNYATDETKEFIAYEEQLLDHCIRRGMAKVTKRNICDIKPFCWDINQICLTTKAMLKTHDENIIKERQEDRGKQHILQRGFIRHIVNS
ncbi:PREDICTED: uncharacterized protein LOC105359109, partial [Ceratosolen solmsi marchali]|uniref:Uncharacterized protein LOC105359109 n=1 Tax=Ceratosolen solmsi marchali TaxID=326594 RepID=A0AAJ6YB24_9HYME